MTDDLDTEPPTVTETEVPKAPRLPAEAIEPEPAGYDPNRWDHYSLRTLVAAVKSFGPTAQKALVQSAVDEAKAAFASLVNDELRGMNSELQKLTGRVDTVENREQGASNRMGGLERELSGIKSELARYGEEIGKLTARVTELEALRGKLQDDTTQQAAASPR